MKKMKNSSLHEITDNQLHPGTGARLGRSYSQCAKHLAACTCAVIGVVFFTEVFLLNKIAVSFSHFFATRIDRHANRMATPHIL